MVRPTVARIDLESLRANYRALKAFLRRSVADGPVPRLIAVVKANAYGHGSTPVARALEGVAREIDAAAAARGAETPETERLVLACADIEEGIELRTGGVRAPILVFGALSISDLNGVFEHDLTPTVSSPSAARALEAAAAERGCRLHCHLKIDTGMNRFGFRHDNLETTLPEVLGSPHLIFDAVYTHFATAEDPASPLFAEQQRRFSRALRALAALGLTSAYRHAANSAAMLRERGTWHQAVRLGLLLYGVIPGGLEVPELTLLPVLSLTSRIVAVKGMRVGDTSGYGATFPATRPTMVAVVPAGYADGLDVRLSGTGQVLVRGRRAPIVGSVCMDSLTIDVTDLDVSPGDEVVVIGAQGDARISAGEIAAQVGTVPHEVLCRTGSRIERIYTPDVR